MCRGIALLRSWGADHSALGQHRLGIWIKGLDGLGLKLSLIISKCCGTWILILDFKQKRLNTAHRALTCNKDKKRAPLGYRQIDIFFLEVYINQAGMLPTQCFGVNLEVFMKDKILYSRFLLLLLMFIHCKRGLSLLRFKRAARLRESAKQGSGFGTLVASLGHTSDVNDGSLSSKTSK